MQISWAGVFDTTSAGAVWSGLTVAEIRILPHNPNLNATDVDVEITGVERASQGLGIGRALKLQGMLWAYHQGYKKLRTGMADTNRRIVCLNDELGFVREPAWIVFGK